MMRTFLVVTALLISSVAVAQQTDDERARMHFQSGLSYYEQARYEDAAKEFVEAYELSQRPALLLNLSQAYERDLKFAEAITELERYLQALPDSPQRRTVETRIERLRELQARVATNQPTTPSTTEGDDNQQAATEVPAPTAGPVAATATNDTEGGSGVSVPGVILVSAGGLLVAASVVTGIMAHSKHSDLTERCPGGSCPARENAQGDIDSGRTLAWVSTGLLAGGVVSAAIGTVLLLTHSGAKDEPSVQANVAIMPGSVFGLASVAF